MQQALQAFLHGAAGWWRCGEALQHVEQVITDSIRVLDERYEQTVGQSNDDRKQLKDRIKEKSDAFQADWGKKGEKRSELLEKLTGFTTTARTSFTQALANDGRIDREVQKQIDELKSAAEANKQAEAILTAVLNKAEAAFRNTRDTLETRIGGEVKVLAEEAKQARKVTTPTGPSARTEEENKKVRFEDGWWDNLKRTTRDRGNATWLLNIIPNFIPWTAVFTLPASLLATVKGWFTAREEQCNEAKARLRRHVQEESIRVRAHYTETQDAVTPSVIDSYFNAMKKWVEELVDQVAERAKTDMQLEIDFLEGTNKKSQEELAAQAKAIESQQGRWRDHGAELLTLQADLRASQPAQVETLLK